MKLPLLFSFMFYLKTLNKKKLLYDQQFINWQISHIHNIYFQQIQNKLMFIKKLII